MCDEALARSPTWLPRVYGTHEIDRLDEMKPLAIDFFLEASFIKIYLKQSNSSSSKLSDAKTRCSELISVNNCTPPGDVQSTVENCKIPPLPACINQGLFFL